MSFERPWALAFLILPLAWAVLTWRGTSRRGALLLKSLALVALVFALAEPELTIFESRMAVAILADTSASVSEQDLEHASDLASKLENARGRHWTNVIPFAQSTRAMEKSERGRTLALRHTAGEAGRGTNSRPPCARQSPPFPRAACPASCSSPTATRTSAVSPAPHGRPASLASPSTPIALAGRPRPELRLDSVTLPALAFTGERFPIDVAVTAPRATKATVEISAEGKVLGASRSSSRPGEPAPRPRQPDTAGAVDLSGTPHAPQLGETRFAQAITLRRPRCCSSRMILPAPNAPDAYARIGAVRCQHMHRRYPPRGSAITRWSSSITGISRTLPLPRKVELEEFVKQGGGAAGHRRRAQHLRREERRDDALERALPAETRAAALARRHLRRPDRR